MNRPLVFIQITSCNRLWYLRNFINSFLEFCRDPRESWSLNVVDNASVEMGLKSYLYSMKAAGVINWIYFRERRNPPWEQYEAKNILMDKINARYVWDVQDDFQVIRPFSFGELIEILEEDTQISTVGLSGGIASKFPECCYTKENNIGYVIEKSSHYYDQGFYRATLFKELGHFKDIWGSYIKQQGSGEAYYQRLCKKKGYYTVRLQISIILGLKICAVRGNRRYGDYFKPVGKYYLKPWTLAKIYRMAKDSKNKLVDENIIRIPLGWDENKVTYCRGYKIFQMPSTCVEQPACEYKRLIKRDRTNILLGQSWYHKEKKASVIGKYLNSIKRICIRVVPYKWLVILSHIMQTIYPRVTRKIKT